MSRGVSFSSSFSSLVYNLIMVTAFAAGTMSDKAWAVDPSRDINTYVLFAYDTLNFKGENTGSTGVISGGNVGVNFVSSDPNEVELIFGGPTFMSSGSQVVAHEIRIDKNSFLWDLFANVVPNSFDPATIHGSGPTAYATPIVSSLPVLPLITPGATDIDVPKHGSLNLAPGNYGALRVQNDATLTLSAGLYNFKSFQCGKGTTINVVAGTEIRIQKDFHFNNGGKFIGSDLAKMFVGSVGVSNNDSSVNFGKQSEFHGQVFAPNGIIALGHTTDLFGRFWGKSIRSDNNVNLYYRAPESVSGKKYRDDSGDGQQNGGEPALSGFTFFVDYNNNNTLDVGEPSAVSDANGDWKIVNVNPGTFNVREVNQAGFTCTQPSPTCFYSVQVGTTGKDNGGNVFGNKPPVQPLPESASGSKFRDDNGDGQQQAGEPQLAGFTFFVDYNDNSQLDGGEPSAASDANGDWSIPNINPGTYKIREVGQPGFTCTHPSPNCFYSVTFAQTGQNHAGNNFGNKPPVIILSDSALGSVFFDKDCNGKYNGADEPPLAGVPFYLDCNNNSVQDPGEQSASTDINGNWSFIVNSPASCTVRLVAAPAGFQCSSPAGTCSYNLVFDGTGVVLGGNVFGFTSSVVNCTVENPESVSGSKFLDANGDGQLNSTESGMGGVTFYVDYNDNSQLDAGEPSAISSSNGDWSIGNITPGTYKVREVISSTHVCSVPAGNCSYTITFGNSGVNHSGNVFGNKPVQCDPIINGPDCVQPKCEEEDNFEVSRTLDGNGFALFKLTQNVVSFARQLHRNSPASCKKLTSKKVREIVTSAQDNYLALWNVAYGGELPQVTFSCTDPAPTVCASVDLTGIKATAAALGSNLEKNLLKAMTNCVRRSARGKRFLATAKRELKTLEETLNSVSDSELVCGTLARNQN